MVLFLNLLGIVTTASIVFFEIVVDGNQHMHQPSLPQFQSRPQLPTAERSTFRSLPDRYFCDHPAGYRTNELAWLPNLSVDCDIMKQTNKLS